MYQGIKEKFCKKFQPWAVTIDDKDLFLGNRQNVPTRAGRLKWVMEENDRGPYIEYYGINEMNSGHMHGRIYDNGEEENLEVLRDYIIYSPNIKGDRERGAKDLEAYNNRIMADLKEKGLI